MSVQISCEQTMSLQSSVLEWSVTVLQSCHGTAAALLSCWCEVGGRVGTGPGVIGAVDGKFLSVENSSTLEDSFWKFLLSMFNMLYLLCYNIAYRRLSGPV